MTKQFDKRVLAGLQEYVIRAQRRLKEFKRACKTCRAYTDTYVKEFNGPSYAFGLGLTNEPGKVTCPKCGRCVWAKD